MEVEKKINCLIDTKTTLLSSALQGQSMIFG